MEDGDKTYVRVIKSKLMIKFYPRLGDFCEWRTGVERTLDKNAWTRWGNETKTEWGGSSQIPSSPRNLWSTPGDWFDKLNQHMMNAAKCDKEAEPSESMSNPSGYAATSSSMHGYKAPAICSPGSLASPCLSAFQQASVQQLLATGASTLRWRPRTGDPGLRESRAWRATVDSPWNGF